MSKIKPKVLLTEAVNPEIEQHLASKYDLQIGKRGQFDIESGWESADPETVAILSMLSNPISDKVMQQLPELKIIANNAVGYNNVDIDAAKARNIIVTNTPDVLTNATADGTLALLMATIRHIPQAELDLRMGKFDGWHPTKFCGLEMHGSTLGIFGMGRIGKAVALRASAFGMKISYTNRNPIDVAEAKALNVDFVPSLKELAKISDVLVALCPLTSQTRHAINASILDELGKEGYLINVSRGPVVDEQVLAQYLLEDRIAGAGLDVFEEEPTINPNLLKSTRCVLTPHIASATHKTRRAMLDMCEEAISAVILNNNPDSIPYRVC